MNLHNIDEVKGVFGSSIPTSREAFFMFILKHMDEADLLTVHNDGYCNYYQDDYIYDNDEYNFNDKVYVYGEFGSEEWVNLVNGDIQVMDNAPEELQKGIRLI